MKEKFLCLCLALLLLLSLTACNSDKPVDEQESQTPTPTVTPAPTPTPTPPIPYTDVAEDADYYDAVVWAYENGIASDGETFEPDSACTRGQVITFMWRAVGSPEPQTVENPISDITPSDWFYKPVLWAWENGIVTGSTFSPGNSCTNAETLTFLWRAEGKPMAAVSSSAVALAASGTYYERPAAWADNNGLFAQTDAGFDPTAPCSRADLMAYLYWVTEEWTFAEEDKTVQAEYEQIINDAQLYEVYGTGLVYADYVDVDNDGTVELLTVDTGENLSIVADWHAYNAVATIYANIDGHAGKLCEHTFEEFTSKESSLYLCTYDSHVCLRCEVLITGAGFYDYYYQIENGAFVLSEELTQDRDVYAVSSGNGYRAISETEHDAIKGKYTNQKELFSYMSHNISVKNRGILPDPSAVMQEIYATVKNGDFSFFAGTYQDQWGNTLVLDKSGAVTGGTGFYTTNQKPLSITVTNSGMIHCVIEVKEPYSFEHAGDTYTFYHGEFYDICPPGVNYEVSSDTEDAIYDDDKFGLSETRIMYTTLGGSVGGETEQYYKVS